MTDSILERLRRLWDLWDIRVLVLLSLNLQIILFIFGNRRKYMSSTWLNMFVWLAYLLADWVATFALGNLSRAQCDHNVVDNSNALGAIWAPLLLLHLGGPDTITAYSLEDNQLWLRQLMGLSVQAFVAINAIFMSWRNYSWFSYLSIPALVAGILKYAERVWVLMSASNDKSGDIVPFDNNLIAASLDGRTTEEDTYVSALVMAQILVKEFKRYMENYDTGRFLFELPPNQSSNGMQARDNFRSDEKYFWDALEVEAGLMYDLFYTKASITYTKCGCVIRSISFICTMSVLVGLFWIISKKEKWHNKRYYNDFMIDIAITGVLLVGALALEIYGMTVILCSDWTMLWLIEHAKREWVIQLRQKFPWFYQKKKWSKKVGQFDLLGFCVKENKLAKFSCIRYILGLLKFEDKFDRYMHQTCVAVPPNLYSTVLEYVHYWSSPNVPRLDEIAQATLISTVKVLDPRPPAFYELVIIFHVATEMCYHSELNDTSQQGANFSSGHDGQIKETCRTLSHYMMYLLLMCPSALPIALSDTELKDLIHYLKMFFKDRKDVREACQMLKDYSIQSQDPLNLRRIVLVAQKIVRNFMGWERLKSLWLGMLGYAAIKGQKNYHLQQLTQGGDFLTLLWFFIPQSNILDRIDAVKVGRQINNQVTQLITSNIDSYVS
ncbi:hypothetical protein ACSBR2_006707 [Camellia fascicularis]